MNDEASGSTGVIQVCTYVHRATRYVNIADKFAIVYGDAWGLLKSTARVSLRRTA